MATHVKQDAFAEEEAEAQREARLKRAQQLAVAGCAGGQVAESLLPEPSQAPLPGELSSEERGSEESCSEESGGTSEESSDTEAGEDEGAAAAARFRAEVAEQMAARRRWPQ